MKRVVFAALAAACLGVGMFASQALAASHLNDPVPSSVIVQANGLEWVWASPCAQNGCTSGILVGKDGFNFATAAQWAKHPPASAFEFGKCASPWFDKTWDHCDWSNGDEGLFGSAPTNGLPAGPNGLSPMSSFGETWLVRGPSDSTPPVIDATVGGTKGDNGYYTSDVTVHWSVSDPDSTVSSKSGCDDVTVSSDTSGTTFTCTAVSDGGQSSKSVTIKRDATPPTVSYSGNQGSYTVADTVSITCSSSDALSGVASDTCQDISGDAYTFALGANSASASAKDNAGNTGSGSTSFTVTVDTDSLCALTKRWVTNAGVAGALCAKLDAAAASIARGDTNSKNGQLGAYRNQLSAQSGKSVTADHAATLTKLSQAL